MFLLERRASSSHLRAESMTLLPRFIGRSTQNLPASAGGYETQVQPLSREDPLEEGMATHSSILAWRIPWTEELGGLPFTGLQRV